MSKISTHIQNCPDCGKDFEISIYDSYNVSLVTSPKSKIINGEIFDYTCPHCKKVHKILYPCLYHDMKKDVLIWFRPDVKSGDYIFTKEEASVFNLLNRTADYVMRVENDYNDFIERIRILDHNLNDKIFEIFKLIIFFQVVQQKPTVQRLFLLDITDDKAVFQVIEDVKTDTCVNIPLDTYNSLCEILYGAPELKNKFCFEKVDKRWVEESGVLPKIEKLL